MLKYFAYGSNLHFARFQQRVPSARLYGLAAVPGFQLCFHKIGVDGSGKCNLYPGDDHDVVHGMVYEINHIDKAELDRIEGGYQSRLIETLCCDTVVEAFTYIADETSIDHALVPFDWYKHYVHLGALDHGLDEDYVAKIRQHPSIADFDHARRQSHFEFLGI